MNKKRNQDKLLEAVFKKAQSEDAPDSANGIATHIHRALETSCTQPISVDAIRGYFTKFKKEEDFNISQVAKDQFAMYVGKTDFKDFLNKDTRKVINKKRYQFLITVLILVIAFFMYDSTRKKCMIWDTNRYVKIHCEEANAKPINRMLLNNFKKLNPECSSSFFFDASGAPKVWYYKKGKGDLDLYSMPGIHPVNGKTLNDITLYMIKAHLCDSLK
ncbi:hypothetical protein ACFQO1_03455 [Jejudonia soesokkakensis]|uniref:Uncharacterized protein n=1 Tax=Jejudonia soesokkakensis TaxID=1323432 RepID=A0ABW2MPB3_9FLAO